MPSPLGHALGGVIAAFALAPKSSLAAPRPVGRRQVLLFAVVAACLPDIDFAWGRHSMETHSIGFAVLVALIVFAWKRSSRLAIVSGLAVLTHILFDWLGSDDFPPLGVMALWPFSSEFYFANAYVFATISRRYQLPGFIQHNVLAVLREVVILAPIAVALWWWRARSSSVRHRRDMT